MKCNKMFLCGILLISSCFSFRLQTAHLDLENSASIKNNAMRINSDQQQNSCNQVNHLYLDTYNFIMKGNKSKCVKFDTNCTDLKTPDDVFGKIADAKPEAIKNIKTCIQSQANWKNVAVFPLNKDAFSELCKSFSCKDPIKLPSDDSDIGNPTVLIDSK